MKDESVPSTSELYSMIRQIWKDKPFDDLTSNDTLFGIEETRMNMLLIAGSQSATTLYLEGSSRRYTDTFDLPKEIAVSD